MTKQSSPENTPPFTESLEQILVGVIEGGSNNAGKVEKIISQPGFPDRQDVLASPEVMAKEVFKWIRRPAIRGVIEDMPDNLCMIRTANAIWEDGQIQIEFPLIYQDWMGDELLDAVVIIQTRGDIDGERQTETIYATVLSAEDADKSGNTLAIKACRLFSETPLLNLWMNANPDHRAIQGVVTLLNIEGESRVILGLDVYLGEMKINSAR